MISYDYEKNWAVKARAWIAQQRQVHSNNVVDLDGVATYTAEEWLAINNDGASEDIRKNKYMNCLEIFVRRRIQLFDIVQFIVSHFNAQFPFPVPFLCKTA